MNVLIQDNDSFYREGLVHFLEAFFKVEYGISCSFSFEASTVNIIDSDIIF